MATNGLLQAVYFTERCNVCGGDYPVTLYEIFAEQTLDQTWEEARPCARCVQTRSRLIDAVPRVELAILAEAADAELDADDAALLAAWSALEEALRAHGLSPQIEPAFASIVDRAAARIATPRHSG